MPVAAIRAAIIFAASASFVWAAQPMPERAAVAAAQRVVLDTYRKEIGGGDKLAAVRTLLIAAGGSTDDNVGQAALFMAAADVAADAGELRLAFQAVDEMAAHFEINAPDVKVKYIEAAVKDARTADARTVLIQCALELIDEAVQAGRFEAADAATKVAQSTAAKLRDAELRKDVAAAKRALDARRKSRDVAEKAIADAYTKLKTAPDDPRANTILGKHLAFEQNDWSAAMSYLLKSDESALRAAAREDAGRPTEAAMQILVADAWWSLAERGSERDRAGYRDRAVYWYSQALQKATGLLRVRAEKRIEEADALASESAAKQALQGGSPPVDLLALVDVKRDAVAGQWTLQNRRLDSPKYFGARIELPYQSPDEYRLAVIAQPLDEPNALVLGLRLGRHRFMANLNYTTPDGTFSQLEHAGGAAAAMNKGAVFKKGRPSQVICTIRKGVVQVSVDGRDVIAWRGDSEKLSLTDYWNTPNQNALFLGAYDCRYRIYSATLKPLSGIGRPLIGE